MGYGLFPKNCIPRCALSLKPSVLNIKKSPQMGFYSIYQRFSKLALSKNLINYWLCKAHALAYPKGEGNYPDNRETSRDAVILVQIKYC
jgi:hypothetical protein